RERLRLFREVCEAVQFAHGRAIIHRDLKPSNILVGGDGSVKLLDFGIARQQEELASGDVTRTGQRFLTPGYAAPEQVRGEAASVGSVVCSLGSVLHELLTGEVPSRYRHPDPVAALERDVVDESLSALAKRVGRHRMLGGERVARGAWRDLDIIVRTAVDA